MACILSIKSPHEAAEKVKRCSVDRLPGTDAHIELQAIWSLGLAAFLGCSGSVPGSAPPSGVN